MSLRVLGCLLLCGLLRAGTAEQAVAILKQQCWGCHSAANSMSDLRLDSRESVLKGGKRGPGRLVGAISHTAEPSMPPGRKLSDVEIATLRAWVETGAPWPAEKAHWAFQKPARPEGGRSIDDFLSARMKAEGLSPAPEADRRTLIRRLSYDLHGLAPSPERVEQFVRDTSPGAYEKLIDELLASPRYGEKWGRHWLDLVRYGDTAGFEQDPYLLYAWRYRDYVIDSFNQDKPYDRFVKEQIAGDELYPDDPGSQSGTGYFTVGPNRDMLYKVEDVNRIETLTDYVDTTGAVFLGLTVGCARCHDHKFDPITQKDYYRLQAIFVPLEKTRVFLQYDPARGYDLAENLRHAKLREIGDQLEGMFKPYQKRLSDEKLAKLPPLVRAAFAVEETSRTPEQRALVEENKKRIAVSTDEARALLTADEAAKLKKIESQLVAMFNGFKAGPFSPGVHDPGREAARTYLPVRGNLFGELVQPGFPAALGGGDVPEPPVDAISTGRRKALAEWLASPDHPLTARVMVNRVWQYHFGKGLVTTPSDFGLRTAAPAQRELLDWLTSEFISSGWSLKKLHKTILLSAAYRRSSQGSKESVEKDPTNVYWTHFERRRLGPEEIRDSMLEASGALNLKMGGRPVVPPVDAEELFGLSQPAANAWIVTADAAEQQRRSVYLFQKRTFRSSMFEGFDGPDGIRSCARRESSNTAPQSLTLLNGRWTMEEAQRLGAALANDSAAIIKQAWRKIYQREPTASDFASAEKFLEKQKGELGSPAAAATELVRALFNSNEFLYVD